MLVDYNTAVKDTAYSIFLNFYKATPDTMLLTEDDTSDLMAIMSVDYGTKLQTVEKDVSMIMRSLVATMPQQYLKQPTIYH